MFAYVCSREFIFNESEGILDVDNEMHLWALHLFHYLYIYKLHSVYIWQQFF